MSGSHKEATLYKNRCNLFRLHRFFCAAKRLPCGFRYQIPMLVIFADNIYLRMRLEQQKTAASDFFTSRRIKKPYCFLIPAKLLVTSVFPLHNSSIKRLAALLAVLFLPHTLSFQKMVLLLSKRGQEWFRQQPAPSHCTTPMQFLSLENPCAHTICQDNPFYQYLRTQQAAPRRLQQGYSVLKMNDSINPNRHCR